MTHRADDPRTGAIVSPAESAREALEILPRERPGVLVSDISRPGENGFWLIAEVRGVSPAQQRELLVAGVAVLAIKE